jgi:hypothetical protein
VVISVLNFINFLRAQIQILSGNGVRHLGSEPKRKNSKKRTKWGKKEEKSIEIENRIANAPSVRHLPGRRTPPPRSRDSRRTAGGENAIIVRKKREKRRDKYKITSVPAIIKNAIETIYTTIIS